ncbi:RICIN domain-containing protein [Actinoplanes oblitus]|uniref:RICIN domain-containing protein n=1 Tax=Actinoplanes oblitus TaxID=3040509 RepID=A0ABY8WVJ4_9ACTN|nr:RICIN domain-containing protein [Actinoplanes oblitus]WIN00844.1 RICIN domain-containing protein [Actinoplanes oblitus]
MRAWRAGVVLLLLVAAGLFVQSPGAAFADGTRWRIQHRNFANKCIDGNSGAGGQAYLWSCVRARNQYFHFDLVEGLYYHLRNDKTGLCLGSNGQWTDSPIYNLPCDGNWATHWSVYNQEGDYYTFVPRYLAGFCMTPTSETDGTGIAQHVCQSSFDQWTWYRM